MTTSPLDLSDMPPCPWCAYPEGAPCMAKRMGYEHLCLRPVPEPSFTVTAIKTIIAVIIIFLLAATLGRSAFTPQITCLQYQDHVERGGKVHNDLRACRWTE